MLHIAATCVNSALKQHARQLEHCGHVALYIQLHMHASEHCTVLASALHACLFKNDAARIAVNEKFAFAVRALWRAEYAPTPVWHAGQMTAHPLQGACWKERQHDSERSNEEARQRVDERDLLEDLRGLVEGAQKRDVAAANVKGIAHKHIGEAVVESSACVDPASRRDKCCLY